MTSTKTERLASTRQRVQLLFSRPDMAALLAETLENVTLTEEETETNPPAEAVEEEDTLARDRIRERYLAMLRVTGRPGE